MQPLSKKDFDVIFDNLNKYDFKNQEIKFRKKNGILYPQVVNQPIRLVRLLNSLVYITQFIYENKSFIWNLKFKELKQKYYDIIEDKYFQNALKVSDFLLKHHSLLIDTSCNAVRKAVKIEVKDKNHRKVINKKFLEINKACVLYNSIVKNAKRSKVPENGENGNPKPKTPNQEPNGKSPAVPNNDMLTGEETAKCFVPTPRKIIKQTPESIELFKQKIGTFNEGEVNVVPVLDQRYLDNGNYDIGEARCGAHALKNALVAMGLMICPDDIDSSWFTNESVFESLLEFIYDTNNVSLEDRDNFARAELTSPKLQTALDELKKRAPESLDSDTLKTFQKVAQQGKFIFFDIYPGENRLRLVGDLAVDSLINYQEIITDQDQGLHALILGDPTSDGHALSVIRNQEKNKEPTFFGFNSWGNGRAGLERVTEVLQECMNNPLTIETLYEEDLSTLINDQTACFDTDGSLHFDPYPTDPAMFGVKKLRINPLFIDYAIKLYGFMHEIGWLNRETLVKNPKLIPFLITLETFTHYIHKNEDNAKDCPVTPEQKEQCKGISMAINGFFDSFPKG